MPYVIRKTDDNQTILVNLFRKLGATVWITSMMGKGSPDAVVSFRGHTILIEFKDGKKPPSQRKLTKDEEIFHNTWQGDIRVISNEDEAISLMKEIASDHAKW